VLLRRITKHVKDQNWFAVLIDFIIVVFGVFIGIQVANWNGDRENRALEQEYLNRLHAEIEFTIKTNREGVNRELERVALLQEIGEALKNGETAALTSDHCYALFRSHIFYRDVVAITSLNELKATGQLLLISDEDLRTELILFDQFNNDAAKMLDNIRIDRMVLSRHHPDLMKLDPTDLFGERADCDFQAMTQDQIFINHFADNAGRFWAYSESVLKEELNRLENIQAELDRVLKRSHAEIK